MKMIRINSFRQWREEYMERMLKTDFTAYKDAPFEIAFQLPLGLPGVVNCRHSAGKL